MAGACTTAVLRVGRERALVAGMKYINTGISNVGKQKRQKALCKANKRNERMPGRNKHVRGRVGTASVRGSGRGNPNPHGPVFHAMPNFRLEDLAYGKLLLHALKYPHQTVNGVFIGSTQSPGVVVIKDAVPLQHHWTNLNPMMEVGLGLVRPAIVSFLFCVN
jgi:hypothetical protein